MPLYLLKRCKCDLCVQNELTALLNRADGISLVIPVGEAIPEFNVYSPLLSLPSIFKTTVESIPSKVPYIYADPQKSKNGRIDCEMIS